MDVMLIWGLALLGISILLLVVELFVPSGGVIALTSGVVGIAGIVCLFLMKESPILWGSAGTLTMLIIFPSAFALWVKILPSTKIGQNMLGDIPEEEHERQREEQQQARDRLLALVGREGTAKTVLRPVGVIEIDGHRYDALAEGVAIEPGRRVRVIEIVNMQIRVRPID